MSMPTLQDLIQRQEDTNRLLKLLIRATLTATNNPIVRKPRFRVVRETDIQAALGTLTINPNQTVTVVSLPEKPETDVDFGFFIAESVINSQKVRHTVTADGGRNRPFNFNATQQEIGANGFTSPNIFPLWTPVAAGVAGNFVLIFSSGLPGASFHRKITLTLKNEDSVAATIQSNGFFFAGYEYDQATRDIFHDVLADTDQEEAATVSESALNLEDIPPGARARRRSQ